MYNIKLTVLSPIHIGTNDNETLSSISDFIVEGKKIFLIDQSKLEKFFGENPQIMEDYIEEVRNATFKKFNIQTFFNNHKINMNEFCKSESIDINEKLDAKEIHPYINQHGFRYIPGTTIKGAIRNALAYDFLLENDNIKNDFRDKIESFNFKEIEKIIFGKTPNYDILKNLYVGDTKSFEKNSTKIYPIKTYHLQKCEATIPINYECIIPNASTEFKIKIIRPFRGKEIPNLQYWNKKLTIEGIFKSLNNLSKKFILRELKELPDNNDLKWTKQFYNKLLKKIENSKNKKAYLCVGKGTTIFGKTILLIFNENELQSLRKKAKKSRVSRNFGWVKIKNKEMVKSEKFPITRLIYNEDDVIKGGFGWIELEEK